MAGAIVASGLALGHCRAFRFLVKPSGQCVTAQPPEEGAGLKKRRAESSSYRRRENWGLIQAQAVGQVAAGVPFAANRNRKNNSLSNMLLLLFWQILVNADRCR